MKAFASHAVLWGLAILVSFSAGCGSRGGEWQTSTFDHKYSFEMPGEPKTQSVVQDTPAGEVTIVMQILEVDRGRRSYLFNEAELPGLLSDPEGDEIEQRLDGAQAGALANIKAKLLESTKISHDGFAGRDFTGQMADNTIIRSRIYLIHRALVQMVAVNVNSKDVTRFFDSFKMLDHADASQPAKPTAE